MEVIREPRPNCRMILMRQGVEGATNHEKRAEVMGRGFTVLRKREVVTIFLILHNPFLKWHVPLFPLYLDSFYGT